jgi:hypothetical protein
VAMSFANFNPTLTYNRMIPNESSSKQNIKSYEKEFNKYQTDIDMYVSGDSYYFGGNSQLTIGGMQLESTPVSKLFFSPENIARIQRKIRQRVFNDSDGKFRLDVDQDEMDLLITMRYIFLDYAKNLNKHIVRQVKMLNDKTVNYIMPDLMANVKQYYGYMKDINTPLKLIVRPMNVNRAGRKTLPSITTTWGF